MIEFQVQALRNPQAQEMQTIDGTVAYEVRRCVWAEVLYEDVYVVGRKIERDIFDELIEDLVAASQWRSHVSGTLFPSGKLKPKASWRESKPRRRREEIPALVMGRVKERSPQEKGSPIRSIPGLPGLRVWLAWRGVKSRGGEQGREHREEEK
jgi:hypothetical protein